MLNSKTEMNIILWGTAIVILFGMVSSAIIAQSQTSRLTNLQTYNFSGSWACTADTQTCPDGSSVGKVPPYCQFDSCVRN
jgi:hypothetical protein